MSWILLSVGLMLVWVAHKSTPREYTAHASREKDFAGDRPMGRHISAFLKLITPDGRQLGESDKTVVIRIDGDSFSDFGLIDGTRALGQRCEPADVATLSDGDIIVIDGEGQYQSGLRLRRFKKMHDGIMYFYEDRKGQPNPRPPSQLWAKVTHRSLERARVSS
jgi:hypothetical protein